jgi:hypothetical protein
MARCPTFRAESNKTENSAKPPSCFHRAIHEYQYVIPNMANDMIALTPTWIDTCFAVVLLLSVVLLCRIVSGRT